MRNFPLTEMSIKSPEWVRWLNELKSSIDNIKKRDFWIWTGETNLTQHHLGRVNIFSIGSSDVDVYLPSVDDTDLYKWIKIVRIGTGRMILWAADNDQIEYSSLPGRIWCNEQKRTAANLELLLVEETKWAIISGTGIWKVA